MLKIESVKLKMIDCGPAIGFRALYINIIDTEETAEISLYMQLQNFLNDKIEFYSYESLPLTKKSFYITAIDGTKRTYLVFTGQSLAKKSNYAEWSKLSEEISKESILLQKDYRVNQLSPPFMIYIGKPEFLTGSLGDSGFYQHFNCIIGTIKQKDEAPHELEEFNSLSAQEIVNHPFGSLVIKCDHNLDQTWNSIIKPIIEKYTITNKIYICDGCDSSSLREYCLISGLRYQDRLENEWTK